MSEHPLVVEAIGKFPATFGLRAFPGKTMRISRTSSYLGDDGKTVWLYLEVKDIEDGWMDFAKGTPAELLREVVS